MKSLFTLILHFCLCASVLFSLSAYAEPPRKDWKKWHDICARVGERVSVSIETTEGERISRSIVIGDKNDRCPGRCGTGCGGPSSYTWECLEHDVCEHVKGVKTGPCKELLSTAKAGFIFGLPCNDNQD